MDNIYFTKYGRNFKISPTPFNFGQYNRRTGKTTRENLVDLCVEDSAGFAKIGTYKGVTAARADVQKYFGRQAQK